MENKGHVEGVLSPYRVLDLTDEKGLFCGKLLGDLGADVVKVERLGGDPARMISPFYRDEAHPERSLFWWTLNTGKRGITLDIESSEGKETFKKLVRTSDFVVESSAPGYMDNLGLGYSSLEKVNPGIIMISITPFGQTGPYKNYKAPDIVAWAMGGQTYLYGDADRPPIRISHHSQSYLHAGAEGAVGAMLALYHRTMTGEGQHVDVSIQESVARILHDKRHLASWDMMKVVQGRGDQGSNTNVRLTRWLPCKDGLVIFIYYFGPRGKVWNLSLIKWMEDEGMADNFLREFDWDNFDYTKVTQETMERLQAPVRNFFMTHTKGELLEGAVKHGAMLYPIATTEDISQSIQLTARRFWVEIEHPELGASITYPGAFGKMSETPVRISRRAPLIGEHNQEVLNELSNLGDNLSTSKQAQEQPVKVNAENKKSLRPKLLEGIRVIDFGWAWTGPLTARAFADYGAEVIKIEGRSRPDGHRLIAPQKDNIPGVNRSGTWNQDNTGKLSLAVNLARPRGADVVKKLIATADVVIENFAGGAMKRMGLDYGDLKKVRPDIIMLSSCLQGQTGPHATHSGFGVQLTSLAGFSYIAGWPDREPAWLSAYTDFPAPRLNVLTILAALDYRRRTGKGQHIDMSQYENALHFIAPIILDYTVNGRVANRTGNSYPCAAPHNAFRCKGNDRWCAIAVFSDEEWRNFCKVIDNPVWTKASRFISLEARKENEEELDRLVETWAIDRPAEEVMHHMQAAGVAAGVVQTSEDLLDHDSQLKHRHYFWELHHPEIGKYRAQAPSFILSKVPCQLQRAPLLGEHNEHILKNLLGMSDDEIVELVIGGIVE